MLSRKNGLMWRQHTQHSSKDLHSKPRKNARRRETTCVYHATQDNTTRPTKLQGEVILDIALFVSRESSKQRATRICWWKCDKQKKSAFFCAKIISRTRLWKTYIAGVFPKPKPPFPSCAPALFTRKSARKNNPTGTRRRTRYLSKMMSMLL